MKGGESYRQVIARKLITVCGGPGRRVKGIGYDQAHFFRVAAIVTTLVLILILVSPVYSRYLAIHHKHTGWTAEEISGARPGGYVHLVIVVTETRKGTELRNEWRWRDFSSPIFDPGTIPTSGLVFYP